MTKRSGTYVYFVQAVSGGNIKIGFSCRPMVRLEQLRKLMPEPLVLLAFAPGGQKEEQCIHMHFIKHWFKNEWFYPAPEILAFIERIRYRAVIPMDELPKSAPYKLMPHRKQQGPRSQEVRAGMAESRRKMLHWTPERNASNGAA